MKIIKKLGENRYEVEIEPLENKGQYQENTFEMVHDYFGMRGKEWLRNADGSVSDVCFPVRITMPIRSFVQVCLPLVNAHQYTQPEHLKLRPESRDSKPYWPYSYNNYVVHYYDEKLGAMTAVLMKGEETFTIITRAFFNTFVKDQL